MTLLARSAVLCVLSLCMCGGATAQRGTHLLNPGWYLSWHIRYEQTTADSDAA